MFKNAPWRPIASREVADYLKVTVALLTTWRLRGKGPPCVGVVAGRGNRNFYSRAEVIAYAARQRGEQLEAWEISRDWLASIGITLTDPSAEGIAWLIAQIDAVDEDRPRTRGVRAADREGRQVYLLSSE